MDHATYSRRRNSGKRSIDGDRAKKGVSIFSEETVKRGLKNGMGLAEIQSVLEAHSRTPVPQNVQFSIRDWSLRAGLMRLNDQLVLTCEEPDVLRAFRQDAGTRKYVSRALDQRSLKLKGRVTPKRMRSLLRELGYIVELGEALT